MMATPRRRLIRELAAINDKFFGNETEKTHGLPSSGGGKRAVNLTGARDPLWTSLHRGILIAYLMRWVVQRLPVSCGESSGPIPELLSQRCRRNTTARLTR